MSICEINVVQFQYDKLLIEFVLTVCPQLVPIKVQAFSFLY